MTKCGTTQRLHDMTAQIPVSIGNYCDNTVSKKWYIT